MQGKYIVNWSVKPYVVQLLVHSAYESIALACRPKKKRQAQERQTERNNSPPRSLTPDVTSHVRCNSFFCTASHIKKCSVFLYRVKVYLNEPIVSCIGHSS